MAPALRHLSTTTTSHHATFLTDAECPPTLTIIRHAASPIDTHQSPATITSSRAASHTGMESPPTTVTSSRAAPPANVEHSHSVTQSNGAASLTDAQHSHITTTSADAAFPTRTRHSARIGTIDQTASLTDTDRRPTATASNHEACPAEQYPVTSSLSASKTPVQGQPNDKTNTSRKPSSFGMPHLLNLRAGDILTALIQRQVNLPSKDVILATGNPLGMMIPTKKKFVLIGGKIRHGRVIEGRVAQVTPKAFEEYMATEYEKAFMNGVEELKYPLMEPLSRTRAPDAPMPMLKEIRAAVAKEVQQAVEDEVEGVMVNLMEEAITSVVEELEKEVEAIVVELVEEAVAGSVDRRILVKV